MLQTFTPALPSDRATSIAQFCGEWGGDFQLLDRDSKFLILLSILDYIGSNNPQIQPMSHAIAYQDGDGLLSEDITEDSGEPSIAEWLCHFAAIDPTNELLKGIARTLFETIFDS